MGIFLSFVFRLLEAGCLTPALCIHILQLTLILWLIHYFSFLKQHCLQVTNCSSNFFYVCEENCVCREVILHIFNSATLLLYSSEGKDTCLTFCFSQCFFNMFFHFQFVISLEAFYHFSSLNTGSSPRLVFLCWGFGSHPCNWRDWPQYL